MYLFRSTNRLYSKESRYPTPQNFVYSYSIIPLHPPKIFISRYCNDFEITPRRSAWKVCIIIPGLKVFEGWWCLKRKVENLSSGSHAPHDLIFGFSIIFNGEFGVIECFHVTSQRPYLNSGAAAMLVYLILRELSSIDMQTFSFVSVDK